MFGKLLYYFTATNKYVHLINTNVATYSFEFRRQQMRIFALDLSKNRFS